MKRVYQIAGGIFLLFSIFVGLEGHALQYYTSLGPGPGFFPVWLAIAMGILSLLMVYHATTSESGPLPDDFFPTRPGFLRAGAVVVAIAWAVVTMPALGFRLSMAAMLIWLMLTLGRVNVLVMLVVTAIGSVGAYWLFDTVLRVPLPIGAFGI